MKQSSSNKGYKNMRTIGSTAIAIALATTIASAQTPPTVPPAQTTPPTQVTPPAPPVPPAQTTPAQPSPQAQTAPSSRPANMPAAQVLTTLPANAATITHWYKQIVMTWVTTASATLRTC